MNTHHESNPTTMNCNLHCWYCYEKHNLQASLSKELKDGIRKLVAQKVEDPQLKVLTLDFFGGEPLLDFQEHILPLLYYAQELCSLHQVKLLVSFTTNGVLLTPEVIAALQPFNTDRTMQIQITLDGNRDSHNVIRKTSDNLPTYDLIIGHVKVAISA